MNNEEIDDLIDQWHNVDSSLPLHEYLGMTWEQYAEWVAAPLNLRRNMEQAAKEKRIIPMVLIGNQAYDHILACGKKTWFFAPRQSGKTTMLASYVLHNHDSLMVVMNTKMRDHIVNSMGVPVEQIICSPNQWSKIPVNTSRKIVIDDFDFEKVTWRMPVDWWNQVQVVATSTLNFDYIQSDDRLKFAVEEIVILNQLNVCI